MRVKPTLKPVGAGATKGSVYLADKKLPIHVPESISGSVEVRAVPVAGGGRPPSNGNGEKVSFHLVPELQSERSFRCETAYTIRCLADS